MGLLSLFGSQNKVSEAASRSFLSPDDYPVNSSDVVAHIRTAVKRSVSTRDPIFLFFDIEPAEQMLEPMQWGQWSLDRVAEDTLGGFPHVMQFSYTFCDQKQNLILARNLVIKPDGWSLPSEIDGPVRLSHEFACARGVPMKDALAEFTTCIAPTSRITTFDADLDAILLEVELRRHGFQALPRTFFMDLSERCRPFCGLDDDPTDVNATHVKPMLRDLYEKLFQPFEIDWHDVAADVQIIQHCFFALDKKRAF